MTLNHFSQLLNCHHFGVAVNHRVAVRANRTQIGNRVNLILSANLGQCLEMVDVNKAAAKLAKDAYRSGKTVRQVAKEQKVLADNRLDELLDPWRMTEPGGPVGSAGG